MRRTMRNNRNTIRIHVLRYPLRDNGNPAGNHVNLLCCDKAGMLNMDTTNIRASVLENVNIKQGRWLTFGWTKIEKKEIGEVIDLQAILYSTFLYDRRSVAWKLQFRLDKATEGTTKLIVEMGMWRNTWSKLC